MDPLLEVIQGHPLALISFGVVLAVIVGIRHLGLGQGQRAAQQGSAVDQGRILGAVIDGKKADEIIAAINRLCDLLEHQAMEEEVERRANARFKEWRERAGR